MKDSKQKLREKIDIALIELARDIEDVVTNYGIKPETAHKATRKREVIIFLLETTRNQLLSSLSTLERQVREGILQSLIETFEENLGKALDSKNVEKGKYAGHARGLLTKAIASLSQQTESSSRHQQNDKETDHIGGGDKKIKKKEKK